MPICEQEDWRALGKVGRLFAILHADVDCLSKMDFTLGLQKLMAIGGVCALAMGVSGAEFTFAPNVEPKPVTMSVESNTLVRLDRNQTVAIACADGSERAVDLGVGGVRTLTAEPIPPARDYSARLSVAAARGGWMGDASFPK